MPNKHSPESAPDDLPLGEMLPDWSPPPLPSRRAQHGVHGSLAPLSLAHSADLFAATCEAGDDRNWAYLPYGPFAALADYQRWIAEVAAADEPMFFAVIEAAGRAVGVASYLNINPAAGSIEVGHIHYSPALQTTTLATEAMFLMMRHAFALGYRRYEWKCNALNQRSRAAAARLGFTFEGVFRQMMVVKGRNRDTAWYSIIDSEWPALQHAYQTWLAADNFDKTGRQRQSLASLTAACRTL